MVRQARIREMPWGGPFADPRKIGYK